MNDHNTQADALYQELLTQLFTETLAPDGCLPPRRELCSLYQVGLPSARAALRRMEQAGLLQQVEPPVLQFDMRRRSSVRALLERRPALSDTFTAVHLMFPDACRRAAQITGPALADRLQAPLAALSAEFPAWHHEAAQLAVFFTYMLEPLQNPMLLDLQRRMYAFVQIPDLTFLGDPPPCRSLVAPLTALVGLIQAGDFSGLGQVLARACRQQQAEVLGCVDRLGSLPLHETRGSFHWQAWPQRPACLPVVLGLLRRIQTGGWRDGDLLPPVLELSARYGVPEKTARGAYLLLRELGLTETRNGVGTFLHLRQIPPQAATLDCSESAEQLLLYLRAFQILCLSVRRVTRAAFPHLVLPEPERLEVKLKAAATNPLFPETFPILLRALTGCTPCAAVRTVYAQLMGLMFLGYHLRLAGDRPQDGRENATQFPGLLATLEAGDAEGFSRRVEALFCARFAVHWQIARELGLDPAQMPSLPEPDPDD